MAYLTISEVAEEEGVSGATVRSWIRSGLATTKGPDGQLLIDVEDVAEFLDRLDTDDEDGDDDED